METFEPLINLVVVLTVLSVAAERLTNILKLRRETLRTRGADETEEREREYKISFHNIWIGVLVALFVKANFFELLTHLDDPWKTFGWVKVENYRWVRSAATLDGGAFVYTAVGCALTGVALGFGSKFWHDVLGTMYELRSIARNRRTAGDDGGDGNDDDGAARPARKKSARKKRAGQ